MRSVRLSLLIGLLLSSGGCALFADATHVLHYKTVEALREYHEWKRNREWAEEAWARHCATAPPSTEDYAKGFKEGFAEYLYRGAGEPPVTPPKHYRALQYQSPEGYRRIQDWFAGYRQGASVAHLGGYRRLITGPTSLTSDPAQSPAPSPASPGHSTSPPGEPDPVEQLPPPRFLIPQIQADREATVIEPTGGAATDPPDETGEPPGVGEAEQPASPQTLPPPAQFLRPKAGAADS
jgi:hypothetical protein